MNKQLQTVYIPTKAEINNLPNNNVFCISEEFNGIAAGKLDLNSKGIVACDTDTIGCTVNYISHWLKPTQAYVFTPEELKQLLSDTFDAGQYEEWKDVSYDGGENYETVKIVKDKEQHIENLLKK